MGNAMSNQLQNIFQGQRQLSYKTATAMEARAHPRATFLKHIWREAPLNTVQILVHITPKDMSLKNKF